MPDLFGNEDRLETSNLKGVELDLFTAKAESVAYESGRNVAQVRNELVGGTRWAVDAKGEYRCDTIFAPKRSV